MKTILFDATPFTPEHLTGAGRLVQEMIRHLASWDREYRYLLFGFAPRIWEPETLPGNFRYETIKPWRFLGPLALEAARRQHIGALVSTRHIDLVHCTLEMTPVYEENTPVLFSLYDLARLSPHFLYSTPQSLRSLLRTRLRYRSAKRADFIHTISHYSAERIAELLRFDRRRIRVIYPGANPLFCPGDPDPATLARHGLTAGAYFLFVGQFGRQKNEDGLIKAFYEARRADALPADYQLALVGDVTALRESTRHLLHGEKEGDRVKLLTGVGDEELLHLYRGATALVLPSFYEGFGLPVLEAMSCGVLPIVSNATSLPEVAGTAGLIVTAGRHEQLTEALIRAATDAAWRQRRREAILAQAARFTYAAMAKEMRALYDEMTHD